MPTVKSDTELNVPEESKDNYPDGEGGGEKEDELMLELTMEELKEAFRLETLQIKNLTYHKLFTEGYLTTLEMVS